MILGGFLHVLALIGVYLRVAEGVDSCTPILNLPYMGFESGMISLVQNGAYSASYTRTFINKYWSVPPSPLIGISTIKCLANYPSSSIDFTIRNPIMALTNMTFFTDSSSYPSLKTLVINYLVDASQLKLASFGYFFFNHTAKPGTQFNASYEGNLTYIINVATSFNYFTQFNYSSSPSYTNKLILFLRKLQMTSTLNNLGALKMYDVEYVDNLRISLTIFKPLGVAIPWLWFHALYFSTAQDIRDVNAVIWGGITTLPYSGGTFITSNTWGTPYMIYGLAWMEFYNDSSVIEYDSTSWNTAVSTITVSPQTSTGLGLKSTATAFFHSLYFICPNFTNGTLRHYYNTVDATCYLTCPLYTVQWATNGKCFGCAYSCYTCVPVSYDPLTGATSNCTSCRAANFRYLVGTQCLCMSSYFDDGYSKVCRSCSQVNSLSVNCTFTLNPKQPQLYYQRLFSNLSSPDLLSLYKSLSCITNSVIVNNLCVTCSQAIPNCDSCTNTSTCISCSASATKYTDQKCYLCNLANCTLCKQDNVCASCQTGYVMNGTGCSLDPCYVNCGCGGYYAPKINGSCTTVCGDGFKTITEECDDNNTIDRDGCSSLCKIQTCAQNCSCSGWYFPVVNNSCSSHCGDGIKVSTEECDDGNNLNHDGCSSVCKIQTCDQNCSCAGYSFPLINETCTTTCGDKIKAGLQECDDGNLINYDGCSSACKTEGCNVTCNCSGWALPRVNELCTTVCGDNIKVGNEECDDGNLINGDGCSSLCKLEPCNVSCICGGYLLPRANGTCKIICGDGIKTIEEQCDDGNTQSHDGCSSSCQIESSCNESCSCGGWTQPFVNGSCSTVCGDGIKQGKEECDDGNTISHDGCSSVCVIESECSQSCLCGGWTQPFINGSCSTICGDGIILGHEECDDNNSLSSDGCSNCTLDPILALSSSQFWFFSQEKTYYPSLITFCFGFRIIGMEMLWVLQSFQLLLEKSSIDMKISQSIHGYSNSQTFPFKLPNLEVQFLDRFNYMFFVVLGTFILCTLLETLGECCRSGNQISNNTVDGSPLSFTKGSSGFKQKEHRFEEDQENTNEEFTVHYDKQSHFKNYLMSETQALSLDMSDLEAESMPPTFFSRLSRIILRQFFFDIVINVQPVIFSSIVNQVLENGIESIMNFPTLITFGLMELFFIGIMIFCIRGGDFFGENQNKFQQNKFMRYWIITSLEKVLTSSIISSQMNYFLFIMSGIKLSVVIYLSFDKIFYTKVQNYRCIIVNVLHLLLYAGFTVQNLYLIPENVHQLPVNLMEYGYTAILGTVIGITAIFYFQELTSNCQANTRKSFDQNDAPHERLFCSRKDIDESATKLQSKNPMSPSIIEEIRSKKYIAKKGTFYAEKSKIASKSKLPEPEYRQFENYQDGFEPSASKFKYQSKTERKVQEQNSKYERQNNFRDTEEEFDQTRYARSTKERTFTKSRRAGQKNEGNTEKYINKENSEYQSRFTDQYQEGKSSYQKERSNNKKAESSRKVQTQKHVKSIKEIKDCQDQENESESYNAVSIRFR